MRPVVMDLFKEIEMKLAWIDNQLSQGGENPLVSTLLHEKELYNSVLHELKVSERRLHYLSELAPKLTDKPVEFVEFINRKIEEDLAGDANEPDETVPPIPEVPESSLPNADIPDVESMIEQSVHEATGEPIENTPAAEPVQDIEEELRQKERSHYHIALFDRDRFWALNSQNEKVNITKKVASLAKGKISAIEVDALKAMGEEGLFLVDDILQNSNEPIKTQAALDSLFEKELVFFSGAAHNKVFMTKLGIWFYTMALKQNPKLFMNRSLNQFNYLSPAEAKEIDF